MNLCLSQIQSLCQELESSFYDGMFPWQQLKQHDAASLLKLFIRELPHPLLTVEYLSAFIAVNSVYTTCSLAFFCSLTGALPPHYETNNLKNFAPSISLCVCVCVHRAPHKEATAAGFEPAGPFVTWRQSGYFEGRSTLRMNIFLRRNFSPWNYLKKVVHRSLSWTFLLFFSPPRLWWSSSSVWLTIRPTTKWPSTMSPLSWHPTSSCSRGSAPRSRSSRSFQWRPARPTSSGCWLDTRIFCGRWGSKKSR